jgi:hypothetical protein
MAKRRVVKRSIRRKAARRPRRPIGTRRPVRLPADRQTKRAVAGLLRALGDVSRHQDLALGGLESMRVLAAEDREQQLAIAALQDHLLDDLMELGRALSASEPSDGLAHLRAVPAAVLRWASVHMNLEPALATGDRREIPVGSLDRYDLDDVPHAQSGDLVMVQVVRPGWKWRGKVLTKPRVRVCS